VNVMSGVRLSRLSSGYVEAQLGPGGVVSSESALNIPADMIHYGFTRTANLAISRGSAKRIAGFGVTVNAVLPGPTLSEGVETMLKTNTLSPWSPRGSRTVQASSSVSGPLPISVSSVYRALDPRSFPGRRRRPTRHNGKASPLAAVRAQ
jgi:NAD(P)-dependent dehydrogenase (short-subunit alcohol dehydrogenase family)